MIYLFNLLFSVIWIKIFQNKNKYALVFPFVFWSFMVGFQHDVGVDYFNYFSIFDSDSRDNFFWNQKEYGFYFFLKILRILNTGGQTGFLLIAILSNYIFYKAILKYRRKIGLDVSVFIFLYFTLTTIFISQMNGIRQYVGIYLFFLSGIYLIFEQKKYIWLNVLGALIHSSLLLVIPIYFFKNILKRNYKVRTLILILIFSVIVSLIDINLKKILENINSLGKYSYYLNDPLLVKKIEIKFKITKFIYLPIYFLAILNYKKMLLSNKNVMLFNLGIFSYSLKLLSLVTFLTIRISELFNFFMIFPAYYLLVYLKFRKKNFEILIIVGYLLLVFIMKYILVPTSEIKYTNFLFVNT